MIGFLRRKKHSRFRELLSAYIDGEVSDSEAREVEKHLSECDECRVELDGLRATVGLLRSLPQLAAPRSFALTEAPVLLSRRTPPTVWTARLATSIAALLLVALLMGDALGLVTQTSITQEGASVAPDERSSEAADAMPGPPGPPRLPGSEGPSTASEAPLAPAAPAPVPTPQSLAQMAQATPSAEMAIAPAMLPSATPAPEMMTAAAPAVAPAEGDSQAVTSAAAAPETATAPGSEEEKVAAARTGESVVTTPETAVSQVEPPSAALASGGEEERIEEASRGIALPLRQLEIGIGAALVVLVLATFLLARRRSGLSR